MRKIKIITLIITSSMMLGLRFSDSAALESYINSLKSFQKVVVEGYYYGPIRIKRPVHLIGKNAVIDGRGENDLIIIEASASGTIVEGFHFKSSGRSLFFYHAGVKVDSASGVVIRNNIFEDVLTAIYIKKSRNVKLINNVSKGLANIYPLDRAGDGIRIYASRKVYVEGNRMREHRNGLYVEHSHDCIIRNNEIQKSASYGLYLELSFDNLFEKNVFDSNITGVLIFLGRGTVFRKNILKNHKGPMAYGLILRETSGITLEGNRFYNNTKGLFLDIADRTLIHKNIFIANGWAVDLFSSCKDNIFYENVFMASTYEVSGNVRETENFFYHPIKKVGNYWDSYRGYDLNGDGIGDIPHRPVSFFSRLAKRYPDVTAFSLSPVAFAIDYAEKALPVMSGQGFEDKYPLVKIKFDFTELSIKGSSPFFLFTSLFMIIFPLFLIFKISRF